MHDLSPVAGLWERSKTVHAHAFVIVGARYQDNLMAGRARNERANH